MRERHQRRVRTLPGAAWSEVELRMTKTECGFLMMLLRAWALSEDGRCCVAVIVAKEEIAKNKILLLTVIIESAVLIDIDAHELIHVHCA